jgi:hypothetical protein
LDQRQRLLLHYYIYISTPLNVAARHVNRFSFYTGSVIAFLDAPPNVSKIDITTEGVATYNSKRPPRTRASINTHQ